jgi:hypothetical protein
MHDFFVALAGGFLGVTAAGGLLFYVVKRYTAHKLTESIHDFHVQLTSQSYDAGECVICHQPVRRSV